MSERKPLSRPEARRIQRLLLYPGELFNVPGAFHWMRVAGGKAYLTHSGQDRIVATGETVALNPEDDLALVSALNGAPLVIELFTHEPNSSSTR